MEKENDIKKPILYIKVLDQKIAELISQKGIHTLEDLFTFYQTDMRIKEP